MAIDIHEKKIYITFFFLISDKDYANVECLVHDSDYYDVYSDFFCTIPYVQSHEFLVLTKIIIECHNIS